MLTPQDIQALKAKTNGVVSNNQVMDDNAFSEWSKPTPVKEKSPSIMGTIAKSVVSATPLGGIINGANDLKNTLGMSYNPVTNVKKIVEQAKSGVNQAINAEKASIAGTENPLRAGVDIASGASSFISSPLAPIFTAINDTVGNHPISKAIMDSITNNPEVQKFAMSQKGQNVAKGAETVGGLANIAGTVSGAMEFGAKAPKIAENLKSDVTENITSGIKNTKELASKIKEKISPTPTIDQIVGKVAQGAKEDIPSFTRGLQNIDTSNIKTYEDLGKTASSKIKDLVKEQDIELAKDTTPRKVQTLATPVKVNGKIINHNFVIDAIDQLKQYYEKTNNIKDLAVMKNYEIKLNPTKGKGLTIKEVNDIARRHGTDLNAYNASGELASGLNKQAAENTRVGLKDTIKNTITDPTIKANFEALDKKMSDTYTIRDLSSNMAEKVNKLTQRLQKPNVLQKFGGIIGKGMRITGIGDLASKLLGIDKVPGASTLNAVEIEGRLAKNLEKINEALSKDDSGFISDITDMASHLPTDMQSTK